MQNQHIKKTLSNWRAMIKKYQEPNTKKASWQIVNSYLPFLGLWVLMYFSLNWSYLITLALAAVNAFFLVRIFIIQHDCGHNSFLRSRRANNVIGFVSSIFSTIPYKYWSRTHSEHHAHNAQMEFRGLGDIFFMTTKEYRESGTSAKIRYRIFRNPIILFLIAPMFYIGVMLRYPFIKLKGWKKIRRSHIFNNLLLVSVYSLLAYFLGWQKFVMVHLPVLVIFGSIAFWFFYIQHQHEDNYKEWKDKWDHLLASIRGSTYYKLPKIFQWLTGNIGFHHIHHLNSRIPNYHLEACAKANPALDELAHKLTFIQSLKCINHRLWDTDQERMISFKEYRRRKI